MVVLALHQNPLKYLGNNLIFVAYESATGTELYKYDGTSATLLKDIRVGSSGSITGNSNEDYEIFSELNNELLFMAQTQNGRELWKTDGTPAGTVLVSNSSENIDEMIVYNNMLLFAGSTSTEGIELWKSDGTDAGTVIVEDKFPNNLAAFGKSSNPTRLIIFNNEVYYKGYGYDATTSEITDYELYKTDGTTITLVKDINPGHLSAGISGPFKIFNNELYFRGKDDDSSPFGLWKTDGIEVGTVKVFETGDVGLNNGSLQFLYAIVFNGELFFNNYLQLWKTDGTIVGTTQLSNDGTTNTPDAVSTLSFKVYSNKLWMRARIVGESDELWALYPGTASVNETTLNAIKIYPNPVTNRLHVSSSETFQTYTIYNVLGKEIKANTILQNDSIDVSRLKNGVYFLTITNEHKTYSKKFIKQ